MCRCIKLTIHFITSWERARTWAVLCHKDIYRPNVGIEVVMFAGFFWVIWFYTLSVKKANIEMDRNKFPEIQWQSIWVNDIGISENSFNLTKELSPNVASIRFSSNCLKLQQTKPLELGGKNCFNLFILKSYTTLTH